MVKKELIELLNGSTTFKTDVAAIVFRNMPKVKKALSRIKKEKIYHMVLGDETSLVVCSKKLASKLKKEFDKYILFYRNDLTAFTIKSDDKVVETPGFLSYLAGKLSQKKINIVQLITNYNNLTLLIEKKDLFSLMDTLGLFK